MQTKSEKICALKNLPKDALKELENMIDTPQSITNNAYVEIDDSVWRITNSETGEKKYLANFTAKPIEDITKDNGSEKTRHYTITGKLSSGQRLPNISIPSEQFPSMNWVNTLWGLTPRIAVGSTNKDHFRDYIQSQAHNIISKTIYAHTGFREINGTLCFLYHGGALGASTIECEIDNDLSKYTFVPRNNINNVSAFNEVIALFNLAPSHISYPLLAYTYLAPLNYFFNLVGLAPSFSLFCKGETGSFKSVMSMLYLGHFREYLGMSETPPTNFHSTSNAIEKMSFVLKDVPLLIDDYHPTTTIDKKRMDSICQRLARGAGDHLSRGRMNSDTSLRASYPPRGLLFITGEDVPDIGHSGLARFHFVRFNKGDIDKCILSQRQNNAKLLNIAMQYYILWLIENSDKIPDIIKNKFILFRNNVHITDQHNRTASNIAWLQVSITLLSEYLYEIGIFDESKLIEFPKNAWNTFIQEGREQSKTQAEEKPVIKFLNVLDELLLSNKVCVQKINNTHDDYVLSDKMIGYEDEEILYLMPEITMKAIKEFFRSQELTFPVSKNALLDALAKQDLILRQQSQGNTYSKRIDGKLHKYMALKKSAFDLIKCN